MFVNWRHLDSSQPCQPWKPSTNQVIHQFNYAQPSLDFLRSLRKSCVVLLLSQLSKHVFMSNDIFVCSEIINDCHITLRYWENTLWLLHSIVSMYMAIEEACSAYGCAFYVYSSTWHCQQIYYKTPLNSYGRHIHCEFRSPRGRIQNFTADPDHGPAFFVTKWPLSSSKR